MWVAFTIVWWWCLANLLLVMACIARCVWADFDGVGLLFVVVMIVVCLWLRVVIVFCIADDCFSGWWLFNSVDTFGSLLC